MEKWHLGDQRPSLHRAPSAGNCVGRYASVTDVFTRLLHGPTSLSFSVDKNEPDTWVATMTWFYLTLFKSRLLL